MDKIVMNTVPNWANILLIIFASVIVVSFIVFIYTAIIENEKINFIAHTTLNGALVALSTYTILTHKDGIYYLENSKDSQSIIKLSDDELEQLISKK